MALLTAGLLTAILLIAPTAAFSQEAPAAFLEALELIDQGELPEAIDRLETLRAGGEAPPQALGVLGGLYLETGRAELALEILTPLAEEADADPAVLYNAGRAAAAQGELSRADNYLGRSLEREPNSPARRELGLLRGAQGRDADAYVYLRPWALNNPDDLAARLAAALLAVRLERVPDAEQLLSDLPQENAGVRLLWGQVLLLKGDPWGALSYLKPLLADPPVAMEGDLHRSLAKAYIEVGEASSAIELLEGRVGEDPAIALQLSLAYHQSGDLDRALTTLEPFAEPVLELDSETVPNLVVVVASEYGRLLLTAGRQEEAVPFLRLATRYDPEMTSAWQALGQALAGAGRREEAEIALGRFQELSLRQPTESVNQRERDLEDPTGVVLREAMASFRRGEVERAVRALTRESELAPEDPRPSMLLSRVLLLSGRAEQALGPADRAAALWPGSADSHYQRGTVLLALRRLEDAEAELRWALDLAADHTAAMSDLAVLLASTDRGEEARGLLERVLELRPDDTVARENLARLVDSEP